MKRRGFTLIELLVVIAIVAILAAILFPVFASAKNSAQMNKCLNNLKQCALAVQGYMNDNCAKFPMASWAGDGSWPMSATWCGAINNYLPTGFKTNMQAYISFPELARGGTVFFCPSCKAAYIVNTYGFNAYYLNKIIYNCAYRGHLDSKFRTNPASISEVAKPSATVMICDNGWTKKGTADGPWIAWYCVPPSLPDYDSPSTWTTRPAARHSDRVCVVWVDGHVTTERYGSDFYPPVGSSEMGNYVLDPGKPDYNDKLWDLR